MAYKRKFTLEAEQFGNDGELTVEDVEAALEEWDDHDPQIESVTVEVDDPVCDPS